MLDPSVKQSSSKSMARDASVNKWISTSTFSVVGVSDLASMGFWVACRLSAMRHQLTIRRLTRTRLANSAHAATQRSGITNCSDERSESWNPWDMHACTWCSFSDTKLAQLVSLEAIYRTSHAKLFKNQYTCDNMLDSRTTGRESDFYQTRARRWAATSKISPLTPFMRAQQHITYFSLKQSYYRSYLISIESWSTKVRCVAYKHVHFRSTFHWCAQEARWFIWCERFGTQGP